MTYTHEINGTKVKVITMSSRVSYITEFGTKTQCARRWFEKNAKPLRNK